MKMEGLYVVNSAAGAFLNLVVGSKTFRLAEFENMEEATEFAFEIAERNPGILVFIEEHQ